MDTHSEIDTMEKAIKEGRVSGMTRQIVVTDNIKHLGKIPNIQIDNWIQR